MPLVIAEDIFFYFIFFLLLFNMFIVSLKKEFALSLNGSSVDVPKQKLI